MMQQSCQNGRLYSAPLPPQEICQLTTLTYDDMYRLYAQQYDDYSSFTELAERMLVPFMSTWTLPAASPLTVNTTASATASSSSTPSSASAGSAAPSSDHHKANKAAPPPVSPLNPVAASRRATPMSIAATVHQQQQQPNIHHHHPLGDGGPFRDSPATMATPVRCIHSNSNPSSSNNNSCDTQTGESADKSSMCMFVLQ